MSNYITEIIKNQLNYDEYEPTGGRDLYGNRTYRKKWPWGGSNNNNQGPEPSGKYGCLQLLIIWGLIFWWLYANNN